MKILVTGAAGFIGSNLLVVLERRTDVETVAVDLDSPKADLERGLVSCEVLFHLAGANRPESVADFEAVNVGVLAKMLDELKRLKRRPLIVFSSSTQALLDNPYGRSKKRAEDLLLAFGERTGTPTRIFRLPGVFGKWGRPNYNSVVATLCYNTARGLPTTISDPSKEIEIVHVDDVVRSFCGLLKAEVRGVAFEEVLPSFKVRLERLSRALSEFRQGRESFRLTDLSDPFLRRLYSTYIAYLPADGFCTSTESKADNRGTLTELLKADGHGQIFVSGTKPGVTRGNHYHDFKAEKFIVLKGDAIIRLRHMSTGERVQYAVSGNELNIVDIPPGWTHSIENAGADDMIVLFWSSEVFDPARPDTYAAEVLK